MLKLEPDSQELQKLVEKYEKWQEDLYDPSMVTGKYFEIMPLVNSTWEP